MARSTPTAAPTPDAADTSAVPTVPVEAVALTDMPVIVALLAYLNAISALAGFPSRPVPESLIQAVGKTRTTLLAALSEPFLSPPLAPVSGEIAGAYDDAWIRESFTALDEALKARFGALEDRLKTLGGASVAPSSDGEAQA